MTTFEFFSAGKRVSSSSVKGISEFSLYNAQSFCKEKTVKMSKEKKKAKLLPVFGNPNNADDQASQAGGHKRSSQVQKNIFSTKVIHKLFQRQIIIVQFCQNQTLDEKMMPL